MQLHTRASFIVLEGGDGAGKTIQAKLLCSALRRRGYKIHATAEPSKSDVGRLIRRSVLQKRKISPESEALLFAADRFLHLQSEIRPALSAGRTVVCDRYMYASFAYQGAQGVDREWLRTINRFAEKPDLAIYLDVPSDVGLRRIRKKKSVMETFGLQEQVRQEYQKLVESGELVAVYSNRSIQKVAADILALVTDRLRDPE